MDGGERMTGIRGGESDPFGFLSALVEHLPAA